MIRYVSVFVLSILFCNELVSQETSHTYPTTQRYKIDTDKLFIRNVKRDLKALRSNGKPKVTLQDGTWKQFYKDDSTKVARVFEVKDLLLCGIYKSYYKNGQLYEQSELFDGKHNGKYISYYKNGQLKERGNYIPKKYNLKGIHHNKNYEFPTKIGTWKHWNIDGDLMFARSYSDSEKSQTIRKYYPNGNIKEVTKFVEDKVDSIHVNYAKDGTIILSQTYKNSVLQNPTSTSYRTGNITNIVSNKKQTGNTSNKATLQVFLMACKYNYRFVPDISQHISLLKDEKELFTFTSDNDFTAIDIPYGEYEIAYTTYFNTCERIPISINKANEMVRVCLDRIDNTQNEIVLLLDEMMTGETVRFDLSSQGCFHSSTDELSVKKMIDHYVVMYKNKAHKISNPQFELLREFEMELRSEHSGGCTTADTYMITNTTMLEPYRKFDASCNWNGFFNLLKLLDLK